MPEEYSAILVAFRLKEVHVTTDFDQPIELSFTFECQAEIKATNNGDDPKAMLEINFKTSGSDDRLAISGMAQSVFSFDPSCPVEARQEIMKTKCLSEATAKIAESVGSVLEAMGLGISITSANN